MEQAIGYLLGERLSSQLTLSCMCSWNTLVQPCSLRYLGSLTTGESSMFQTVWVAFKGNVQSCTHVVCGTGLGEGGPMA